MKKLVLLLFMAASTFGASQAQVLNQLTRKIIDKTIDNVVESTSDKVAEKSAAAINKSIGKVIDKQFGDVAGAFEGVKEIETLPANYEFDYIYTLKMTSRSNSTNVDYFLSSNGQYTGARMEQQANMMIIFDETNQAMITVMDGTAFATGLNTKKLSELNVPDKTYKTSSLSDKKFLGYNCKGTLMEDGDESVIVYYAPNISIGLLTGFNPGIARLPGKVSAASSQYKSGLVMYMEANNKKDKKEKEKVVVECVGFKKAKTNIAVR